MNMESFYCTRTDLCKRLDFLDIFVHFFQPETCLFSRSWKWHEQSISYSAQARELFNVKSTEQSKWHVTQKRQVLNFRGSKKEKMRITGRCLKLYSNQGLALETGIRKTTNRGSSTGTYCMPLMIKIQIVGTQKWYREHNSNIVACK